jgi:hypothetical protein
MADLTKQILDFTSKGLNGITEVDRAALLKASTELTETLENPMEMMTRMFFVSFLRLWPCTNVLFGEDSPSAMHTF